ncbi:MAG: RDD family protein [Acidimicrobiales bacterium]
MTVQPPAPETTVGRQGNYAGAVSRLVAFAVDIGVIWLAYTVGAAALSLFTQLVTGHRFMFTQHQVAGAVVLVVWGFVYFAYQWSLGGKTVGDALIGVQVVQADGAPVPPRRAVLRTLMLPLSFVCFGLGLIGIVVQRERRALHDLIAGTAMVYDWDARAAHLRWLARNDPRTHGAGHRRWLPGHRPGADDGPGGSHAGEG